MSNTFPIALTRLSEHISTIKSIFDPFDHYAACWVTLSPAQTLQVIHLRLTCNWKFELLAMACNTSFNMLNIYLAIL